MKLPKNGVIIVEGIHALNPILTSHIDEKYKFKIYISALNSIKFRIIIIGLQQQM